MEESSKTDKHQTSASPKQHHQQQRQQQQQQQQQQEQAAQKKRSAVAAATRRKRPRALEAVREEQRTAAVACKKAPEYDRREVREFMRKQQQDKLKKVRVTDRSIGVFLVCS